MKPWDTNNITLEPIERIRPNPWNAREHSEIQVAEIARSIETFGFTLPILTDEHGMILAGECKLLAAQKLKLTVVPVLVIAGLTETEKLLYLIADNQLALNATWDQEKLRTAIEELERKLADLDLTGLSPQEIDRVLADLAPDQGWTDEDDVPGVSPIAMRTTTSIAQEKGCHPRPPTRRGQRSGIRSFWRGLEQCGSWE
jgi:ParB-like chromosome segregation protein Spo0J